MKQTFNRYELISIILDNMQIFNQDNREAIRIEFAKFDDTILLKNYPMIQSIRKGFYTVI